MNFASTWLDRLRLNRGHSSADDYDSSGKPLTIDDFLRRDHRTRDIVSDSPLIRSDLDLSKTKSDPEPNEIQSYGFFRAAVISGDNHRRKQSNPKHFPSETNEDEDPLLATAAAEAAEISEETDSSYDDAPILSGVHVVNTSSLSSKSAAEISVTRRTESDSAGDNGDEETDSADHEVATSSRISKSAAATAEISKRRRIAAESDGEDDGEEEEKDLTGFTKSEVTVIDTSFEIWRSQKLVFRKGNVWRVKVTSRVFSSKKKTKKKKKKKRNGDVDDGEVSKLVKARR